MIGPNVAEKRGSRGVGGDGGSEGRELIGEREVGGVVDDAGSTGGRKGRREGWQETYL